MATGTVWVSGPKGSAGDSVTSRCRAQPTKNSVRWVTIAALVALGTLSSNALATLQYYTNKATFQTAAPGLVTEDFEAGHLGIGGFTLCSDPFFYATSDDCWNAGDILPGITIASSSGTGVGILGPAFGPPFAPPSIAAAANDPTDAVEVGFPGGTPAVGMDLFDGYQADFTISIFGANDALLGTTTVPIAASGGFFGVTSTQAIKRIELTSADGPQVDNVSFASPPLGSRADVAVSLSGAQAPAGTWTYTLTATNLGPGTASGVVASLDIPPGSSYVSDDCGGSNASPPWSRTTTTLALNASVVCHIVTTVVKLGVVHANVVSNATFDLNPTNDTATFSGPVADLVIQIDGVQAPLGTMTYTLQVGNIGPETASGIVASVAIPPSLSFVSDDCGGSNASPPWKKNIATLAMGGIVVCHIVATVLNPSVVVNAMVVSNGSVDLHPENDTSTGYGPVADLSVQITGAENPPGTVMLTVTVTNLGPDSASSIVTSVNDLLSTLAYVSDDCGGSNALPWTWNIASLANTNNVVCHIHTTVASPKGLAVLATVVSNGPADTNSSNDKGFLLTAVTGVGSSTPDTGFALFRSFYDVALKDETGAPFSLRSHADKVMLLQVCTSWCSACNAWTNLSAQLAAAVDQKIGAGHFLDVDMLTQGPTTLASTQTDAQTWKAIHSFPGPVVHAEGSATSPLALMDLDRGGQYAAIPSDAFYPEFFILAPDCNNQVAIRVSPGDATHAGVLNEQRGVDTTSIDEMADLIADVWNNHPCVKPVLHRLDRCNVGSTQIYSNSQTGDFAEAAEPFNVPNGKTDVISSVTAVTDASILDFTVYADAVGHPGSAVCTSPGRSASEVYAPGVKRINLDKACKLISGNYWMSLKGHSDVDASFVPTWQGGFLPPSGSYFYRDNNGCTAWNAAGQCLAGQQNAQLCYVLETDVLFSSGFE